VREKLRVASSSEKLPTTPPVSPVVPGKRHDTGPRPPPSETRPPNVCPLLVKLRLYTGAPGTLNVPISSGRATSSAGLVPVRRNESNDGGPRVPVAIQVSCQSVGTDD